MREGREAKEMGEVHGDLPGCPGPLLSLAALVTLAVVGLAWAGEDPSGRIAILEDTRSLGDDDELFGFLSHGNPKVRSRACLALGRIQASQAIAPLRGLLKDPDPSVRREAAFAIGQIAMLHPDPFRESEGPGPEVIQTLSSLSREKDAALRARAAEALGKIGGAKAAGVLQIVAGDPDGETRRQAAIGLARMRAPDAIPVLKGLLDDPIPEVRSAAAYAMGIVKGPLPLEELRKALKDKDPSVRFSAYQGIRRRDGEVDPEIYEEGLGEEDPAVLVEVLWGLAANPPRSGLKEVAKHKDSPHFQVRAALARCLAGWQGDEAYRLLLALSRDPSGMVRIEVATALGSRMEGVDELLRLAGDDHFHVRAGAGAALKVFIGKAREEAIRILAAPMLQGREDTVDSLRLAGRLASSPLWSAGSEETPWGSPIRNGMEDPSEGPRAEAARAAQPLPREFVRPMLLSLQEDADPWVRAEAALTLHLHGEATSRQSLENLPDGVGPILAGAVSDDPALANAALEGGFRHPHPRVRAFAARALGEAGPGGADLARRFLEDEDATVMGLVAHFLAGKPGDLDLLEAAFSRIAERDDTAARIELAWILPEVEAGWSVPLLDKLSRDPSKEVREIGIHHLAWVSGSVPRAGADPDGKARKSVALFARAGQAYRALGRLAADDNVVVSAEALAGLALIPTPSVKVLHLAAVSSKDPGVADRGARFLQARPARESVPALAEAYRRWLDPGYQDVRLEVVRALAAIRGKPSRLILGAALSDPDPSVREEVRLIFEERSWTASKATPLPRPEPSRHLDSSRPLPSDPRVILEPARGKMVIQLYPEAAPIHVRNFLTLVEDGFYDGLTIHRVVPNFVIQGGDPLGTGWGYGGEVLRDEINMVRYVRGAFGMPKAGKDTGGCQFFITHVATPWLDGRYTAFGQVTSGLDVIDRMEVGDRIEKITLATKDQ